MSKGQRISGEYLLSDSSGLVVSTAKDVADTVGVSESTVVRFAKELGYRGFPDLKQNLRKELGPRLRAAMRMNQTIAGIGKTENVLTNLIERDIQLLRSTLESMLAIVGSKKKRFATTDLNSSKL